MRITTWLGIGDGNGICIWMYLVYVITSGIYIYYKLVGNGWLIMIDIGYIYIVVIYQMNLDYFVSID